MKNFRDQVNWLKAVFLATLLVISYGVQASGVPQDEAEPVNFLLITADDLEWSSVGAYGSKVDGITPNIDRLASEGRVADGAISALLLG